jgi:hypothetical protein
VSAERNDDFSPYRASGCVPVIVCSQNKEAEMPEEHDERRDDLQNPITNEGAEADPNYDSNEGADARVRIEQPSGEEAPKAG